MVRVSCMRKRGASRFAGAVLMVATLGVLVLPAHADEESKSAAQVEVAGLRVVGPAYGQEDALRAFNYSAGVALALRFLHPEGGLISFDDDASKLEALTDDKGTDLLPSQGGFGMTGFSMSADFSEDAKAALVELGGGTPPAKGAREVHAKGTAVFTRATKKETFTQSNVKAAAGEKITTGPINLEITKAGKPDWGEDPLELTFKATQDLEAVAAVRFLDADGKEIESSEAGSMRMSSGNSVVVEKSYTLSQKVEAFTFEVTCWTDMAKLEIPFDVTAGVGL